MVDVGSLKHQVARGIVERSPDGLTPAEQLDAIAIRLRPLVARQYRCFRTVAGALAAEGARLGDWGELAPAEHTSLERWCAENVAPVLTPKALTRAPGHSFPHLGDRRLSLAVLLRDGPDGPLHFASVECPSSLPRLVAAPAGGMVPLESMVRAHLGALFPRRGVVETHAYRLTRSSGVQTAEAESGSDA